MKRLYTLLLSLALTACGGGYTTSATTIIALYGDSYSSPYAKDILQSNANIEVLNYSVGGTTTVDAISGSWRYDQEPFKPFNNIFDSISSTKANTLLIRYGIADSVLTDLSWYKPNILYILDIAKIYNKRVILVNIPNLPATHYIDDTLQKKFSTVNIVLNNIAIQYNVTIIDLYSTVTLNITDMHSDGLHITTEATKKVSEEMARQLKYKL